MPAIGKSNSITAGGIKYRLKISFCLMSILPLLVCIYLASRYIFPKTGFRFEIVLIMALSAVVALLGYFLIREVFGRIVSTAQHARLVSNGDYTRQLPTGKLDEVDDLGDSFNSLARRIRNNVDELKSYSDKSNEINLAIQERIVALAGLFQVSSLICQGAKFDAVLKLIVEKAMLIGGSECAYLLFKDDPVGKFYLKEVSGVNSDKFKTIIFGAREELFDTVVNSRKALVIDRRNLLHNKLADDFHQRFMLKNTIAFPVYLKNGMVGLVGIGNNSDGFLFTKEDVELLDVFAKQIVIAGENEFLTCRLEKLEIKDNLTGLYNYSFMRGKLEEEIKRSIVYQRPCSFMIFDIDNFEKFIQDFGALESEEVLKRVAYLVRNSVSEIDWVGRVGDDEFAVMLLEKNKRQAHAIADEIRKKIEFAFSEETDIRKRITISGGISENPLDGMNSDELIGTARRLLGLAKYKGRNMVVSF